MRARMCHTIPYITINCNANFLDEYANRVSMQVFQIIISEETMQKINYENMGTKVLNNPDVLLNISDGWFIEAHFMDYKNEK